MTEEQAKGWANRVYINREPVWSQRAKRRYWMLWIATMSIMVSIPSKLCRRICWCWGGRWCLTRCWQATNEKQNIESNNWIAHVWARCQELSAVTSSTRLWCPPRDQGRWMVRTTKQCNQEEEWEWVMPEVGNNKNSHTRRPRLQTSLGPWGSTKRSPTQIITHFWCSNNTSNRSFDERMKWICSKDWDLENHKLVSTTGFFMAHHRSRHPPHITLRNLLPWRNEIHSRKTKTDRNSTRYKQEIFKYSMIAKGTRNITRSSKYHLRSR